MSIIDNLIECVDKYLNTGELLYTIPEGHLKFISDSNKKNIHIHCIFLIDKFQNKGILTEFIKYLSVKFDEIWFYQCNVKIGLILMTTKLDDKYFINNYTGEYYWIKNNNNYDALKAKQIYDILYPLKTILKTDKKLFYYLVNTSFYRELF